MLHEHPGDEATTIVDAKEYIGVKRIEAAPMKLGRCNELLGRKLNEGDDPEADGYIVYYPDGYCSWSPKKAFEEAYCELIPLKQVKVEESGVPKEYLKGEGANADEVAFNPVIARLYASDKGFIRTGDEKKFNNFHQFIVESGNDTHTVLGVINFQKGPIKENGVNGITEMDLLNILESRYAYFQASEFASEYNRKTLEGIHLAQAAQRLRNYDREQRGVEGTNQK